MSVKPTGQPGCSTPDVKVPFPPKPQTKPGCSTQDVEIKLPTAVDLGKKVLGIKDKQPTVGCSTPNVALPSLSDIFKKVIFGNEKK